MFYFPVYASGLGFFFETFRHRITTYAFGQMRESLERLKQGQEASRDEISKMEEAVDQFEETLKKEEKKESDDAPNDDDPQ